MFANKADVDQIHVRFKNYAPKEETKEINDRISYLVTKEELE